MKMSKDFKARPPPDQKIIPKVEGRSIDKRTPEGFGVYGLFVYL